jgi:hypothetical protein
MTRTEYVDSVFQIIKNNERGGAGIPAAALGQLVLKSLGVSWTTHGYPKLSSLLQELAESKRIKISNSPKGALAVQTFGVPEQPLSLVGRMPYLRNEIWGAFVNSRPHGRRFLDRTRGVLRMGLDEPPTPAEQWVEIKRTTDEAQKTWFCDFLQSKELASDARIRDELGSALWFVAAPKRMREINPDLIKQWNWARSERVTQHVFNWCDENGVPRTLVTAPAAEPTKPLLPVVTPVDTPDVREQILTALGRMSTEELLEVPIPAKYLLTGAQR